MINDLSTTSALWKFSDDTTLAEVIPKSSTSTLQNMVDGVLKWTDENVFRLNPTKCKGMQIDFRKKRGASSPLKSEGKQFEVVKSAKILDLTIRDDLKWNDHIDNVTVKASQRVYLLKQLMRADIDRIFSASILLCFHEISSRVYLSVISLKFVCVLVGSIGKDPKKVIKDNISRP